MAKASTTTYGNDSISMLKGAERVRKRPSVIFGSDGLEGCEHAVFEILSNAIDEAREGFGNIITVTRYEDKSIEVEDLGRGCPVDWNEKEQRYNWELIFCEMYAGGKYKNNEGENYEYSLGLNGLGACATQYASEYMDVTIWRDGKKYSLHFRQGEVVGGLESAPADRKKTGTTIRWRPDLEVFTDIDVPESYFQDVLHRQAVVNKGVTFRLRVQRGSTFETTDYCYADGILDYVKELAGEDALTAPAYMETERRGRDRADKPEYKVKISAAFCFSNRVNDIEYYHNSSWLEYGGAPEKATKTAFVYAIDKYLKDSGVSKAAVLATDGTRDSKVYEKALLQAGIEVVYPSEKNQKLLMSLIYDYVKAGKPGIENLPVQELVDEVKAMGAQKMILGCTELPIAFERVGITEDTVDPTTVLAQRAIQKVGAKVKKEYLIA